jgi:hypothetical protein
MRQGDPAQKLFHVGLLTFRETRRAMRRRWIIGLFICLLVGHMFFSGAAPVRPAPPGDAADVVLSMLQTLDNSGFVTIANHGQGGLAATWQSGGHLTDPGPSPDAMLLTDARYLHVLWQYIRLHPTDTAFLAERNRYTMLLKASFPMGQPLASQWWAELQDIAALSADPWYMQAARQLAAQFEAQLFHPQAGAIYWRDAQHPLGWYQTADALEVAAALVVEGQQTGQPRWIHDGLQAVAFVNAHAYFPIDQLYFGALDTMILPSGSVNPNEAFAGTAGATVYICDIAREALALWRVAAATHNAALAARANDLLTTLTPTHNTLHLWDDQHQGYNHAISFSGSAYLYPGSPGPPQADKYPADQAWMLRALLTIGGHTSRFFDLISAVQQVLLASAYQARNHIMVVQMTSYWTMPSSPHADWADSTTMTLALESLLWQAPSSLSAPSVSTPIHA